jgi:hypothetical protein
MPTKKIYTPQKRIGKGYVGLYISNELGWCLPDHLRPEGMISGPTERVKEGIDYVRGNGERMFLCKITIEPIKDKKGRPITKIVRRKEK